MNWAAPTGDGKYVVIAPLKWDVGRKGSGLTVEVPVGFRFDFSAPIGRHNPRFRRAAALHDWALNDGWRRPAAAGLFEDALSADGVGRVQRLAMTLVVLIWKWR